MAAPDELEDDVDDELDDLDDEDFDPDVDDTLEPGLDDELVAADELDPEDEAIEVSLSAVEDGAEADEDDDVIAILDDMDADEDEEEDEEEGALSRVVEDEDDDVEGLREGEFICSSCYLAKGPSQLADAKRQVCVDCI